MIAIIINLPPIPPLTLSLSLSLLSGATVECPGLSYTPLHYAAEAGHKDIVQILLDNKANPTRKTLQGKTPYHLAFESSHHDVMYILQKTLPPLQRPYETEYSVKLPSDQVISCVRFLEDSNKLITGSWDGIVSIIRVCTCISVSASHSFIIAEIV